MNKIFSDAFCSVSLFLLTKNAFDAKGGFMPKLKTDERFKRVMKFLMASNEPKIAGLLALRGFTAADRQEGWALLDKASGRHMAADADNTASASGYNTVVEGLDDWENTWFDVANAALGRKFPAVRDALFSNLTKVSGAEVVMSVRTFLGRMDELADGDEQAQAAVALLSKRGLTAQRMDEARTLLEKLSTEQAQAMTPVDTQAQAEAREAAIKEMWAWFLDWSVTARTVIKNRNYHVMLGLASHHGSNSDKKEIQDEAVEA